MTRLRQLRLARGWTMDHLLAEAGGIVTKSALSKYELGDDVPSAQVASKLASALGVKAIELFFEPSVKVSFTGYRKTAKLTATQCEHVEAMVSVCMERRLAFARLLSQDAMPFVPHQVEVRTGDDVEDAAQRLRKHWKLGADPIVKPIACLEGCGVHVIDHNGPDGFTGLSGTAIDQSGKALAVVVVCRTDQAGERQGLTALHEIGHVYTRLHESLDDKQAEKLMYRFAGAFHAPADAMRRCFGGRRTDLLVAELLEWKKVLRLSMGALVYRLGDLGIISENLKQSFYRYFKRNGWDKREPNECRSERPVWLHTATLRLLSEGVITHAQAERVLGNPIEGEPLSLKQSREFFRLPTEARRKQLRDAAERSAEWYAAASKRGDFDVADTD
jgi:transcriptional regulator with XRE-family HTH domain/Zn-dependent peptidase ImmA (M78 family)